MDIYVLSSIREGLPNVVLEAMALEVPVVATRVAGVPALIQDQVSGVIVEPGQTAELIRGLELLVTQPARRDALSQAARERVERHFSFAERMRKIARIYEEVLGN
jgi:glycosyltransferase involved in cell wall biosynthesis